MSQFRRSYIAGTVEELRNLLNQNVNSGIYPQLRSDLDLLHEVNSWLLKEENEAKVDE